MKLIFIRKLLPLFIFLSTVSLLPGQDISLDYEPIRSYKPSEKLVNDYILRFGSWAQDNKFEKEKIRLTFIRFVQQKADFLDALDSLNVLMYSDPISNLLNSIKDKIIAGNEELQGRDFKIFTYRTTEPNAFSFGEGLILVSSGLLERMPNVDQVAFVISHEMAHDLLNHAFENLQRLSESIHDEDTRKMFQKAARKRAGRSTNIKNVMNAYRGIHMRYNQRSEFEADSLGYVLFQNAGYSSEAAQNALDVLDHSDHLTFEDTINLRAFFNFPEFPFKSYWLDPENSSTNWVQDTSLYFIPDSLKSHPGCDERIKKIIALPHQAKKTNKDLSDDYQAMERLIPVLSFENVESLMNSKDYVMALFISLHLQNAYPDNKYLDCVTAHSLIELGAALTRNEFLEFVEFQDNDFPAGYNQMLTFLHNMNSGTLYKLAGLYIQYNIGSVQDHPYAGFLKIISDPALKITAEVMAKYESEYHDEKFGELLQERIYKPIIKSKK